MKNSLINHCLKIARDVVHDKKHPQYECYKHFTFIISDNQLVEWGMNRSGPPKHGYQPHQKIHSENMAWNKARGIMDRKKTFEILNIRLNKRGDLKISKPCNCCVSFLRNLGCNRAWFSTDAGFAKLIM